VLEPILVGHRSFRETVLHALAARGHLVLCRNGDASFFVDPTDRGVGAAVMWLGGWQRGELERAVALAAGKLAPDAVFVDAGAHIGTQTVYALKSGLFARAVAFEPEPGNAELLRMNARVNNFGDRVTVVEKAVGERSGSATLYLHPRNKGHHTIGSPPSYDGRERMDVPMVRIDETLAELGVAQEKVGLVWIDVEGWEPQAVRGLGTLVERKVPLAMEYAPTRYSDADRADLRRRLEQNYTVLHWLDRQDGAGEAPSALAGVDEYADVILT
jgi:FkbM family methyltransferase